jgi:protein-tyrosine kinase
MENRYKELDYITEEMNDSSKISHKDNNIEDSFLRSLRDNDEEMLSIYQNINILLPDLTTRIIQFISSYEGEGTTTIVQNLAKIITLNLEKIVLILDANRSHLNQEFCSYINKIDYGWDKVIKEDKSLNGAIYQIKNMSLYISPLSKDPTSQSDIFDIYEIKTFWEKLRQRFDIILIDSPPVTTSHYSLNICSTVDGVIIVFEADKTQWTLAKSTKEKILKNGGKILGIVFNKKRSYVPEFINKIL